MFQWIGKLWNSVFNSNVARRSNLRKYLAGDVPGSWSSDHYEETARYTGYTYCAIRALAKQFAQAELKCNNAQVLRLLTQPNPKQSGSLMRYQAAQQIGLTASAYHWFVRNEFDVPVECYILPTAMTRAQPPNEEFPHGSYRVEPLSSWGAGYSIDGWQQSAGSTLLVSGAQIDARHVHAVRWPHPLYLNEGLSALSAGALQLDISDMVAKARWYAMRNAAHPGLTIKLTDGIHPDEQQQLEEEIAARNSSPHNCRRNMLLPPGADLAPRQDAAELEFLASHGQSREDVLALFSTPPIAIGITEAGSYSAFYAAMLQYIELVVQPELDLYAEELSGALGCRVELHARRVDDPQIKQQELAQDVAAKAITINEYRLKRGYPPIAGGDVFVGGTPTAQEQPEHPDPIRESLPEVP